MGSEDVYKRQVLFTQKLFKSKNNLFLSHLSSVECAKVLGLPSMPILGHEKVPLVEKTGFQTMMRLHVEESELGSPFQTCI